MSRRSSSGRPQVPEVVTERWSPAGWEEVADRLAAEEPLQLLIDGEPLSIVMRTPGRDVELALGLLWAERVITDRAQVRRVRLSAEAGESELADAPFRVDTDLMESNQVDVNLSSESGRRPERSFLSTSACGVCGATTLESLALDFQQVASGPFVDPTVLGWLPERLRAKQRLFDQTGGLHAAGLFDAQGNLDTLREDVGRHNAVDKVVGRALLDGRLPLAAHILLVSGRGGYEIVQKAVAAGIPMVAAVGAPSSLAVATARRFGVTLVGFLRDRRFNVYSAPERLRRFTYSRS
ncbi:MAG TPA: formate dehydrogenase accessory sulfurtransferase FdhD [Candidatus Dormibacteraeota bacterium]|nr:formate dehydrogenase accessory sulfurtransferase FdhD [Candidatus Dormibacteraeota bacterium]